MNFSRDLWFSFLGGWQFVRRLDAPEVGFPHSEGCSAVKESERVTELCLTLATPWTVAHQAPLSMGFSRQEYWSGLPFPSPGDLLDPGIEPRSPTSQVDSLLSEPPGKPASRDQNPNSKTQQASQSLSEGHRLVSLLPAEGWSLSALRSPTKHHAHGNLPPSSLNFKLTYLKFPLTFR